ncbi:MAG: hypothetical protein K0R19_1589 [Bacillota bacterium]|nr:hypothetical protein [Bacillota bacterium]
MRQLSRAKRTLTYKNTKRGFLTVEAAIFLPIFIIGVLTIAYLIKFMAIQERVFHALTDEARALSAEAVLTPLGALNFEAALKSRLYSENDIMISNVDLDQFHYLYADGTYGMISMDLNYDVDVRLPLQFYSPMPVSESLMFRAFIGKTMDQENVSLAELEKEKESHLVWIFPTAGKKHHDKDCIYIANEPMETSMTAAIKRSYDACKLCESKNMVNGSTAYVFTKSGKVYHRGSCPIVDKYVTSIEKEEAQRKGYSPCSKCGGG